MMKLLRDDPKDQYFYNIHQKPIVSPEFSISFCYFKGNNVIILEVLGEKSVNRIVSHW